MKSLYLAALLLFFAACADKKEDRESYKEDHNARHMNTELGETAATVSDSTGIKNDSISTD